MKFPRIEGAFKVDGFIKPMLAELSSRPAFTDSKWLFEIKYDGYRAIAEVNSKDQNRLYSRNGTSFMKAFPKVYNDLNKLRGPAVIDGEIVVYNENDKPSFQHIQNYSSKQNFNIQFQVFDILRYNGKDLCDRPLIERKELLKGVLPDSPIIRYCDHIEREGELLFEQVIKMDLEGIIAKKATSKYSIGSRCKEWLKIRNHKFDEFIIIGYLHDNYTPIKSLLIADIESGKLKYRGAVSGFSNQVMNQVHKLLSSTVIEDKPVSKHEKFDAPVAWVRPQYICKVRYTEITIDGILRHPIFQGLIKTK
jgi:bifunctional non-homologous end joining protein LigD